MAGTAINPAGSPVAVLVCRHYGVRRQPGQQQKPRATGLRLLREVPYVRPSRTACLLLPNLS